MAETKDPAPKDKAPKEKAPKTPPQQKSGGKGKEKAAAAFKTDPSPKSVETR